VSFLVSLSLALLLAGGWRWWGPGPALLATGVVLVIGLGILYLCEARARDRRLTLEGSLASRLLRDFPGAVVLVDEQGVIEQVNPDIAQHVGYAPVSLVGRRVTLLDTEPLAGGLRRAIDRVVAHQTPWQGVLSFRLSDGEWRYRATVILPDTDNARGNRRLLILQQDVTGAHRDQLHDRIFLSSLQNTVSRLPAVVFESRHDRLGRLEFLYLSEGLQQLCGLSPDGVIEDASRFLERVHPDDRHRLAASLTQSSVSLDPWYLEFRLSLPEGARWLEGRAISRRRPDGNTHWDGLLIDISERKHTEQLIQRLVGTDMLTGVLNRRAFFEQGEAVLAHASRRKRKLPLAMLDLDHFKQLNDTLGHAAGDLALENFAMTCLECLRPYDIFARIGGEEFAVLLVDTELEEAWAILERLRQGVERIELDIDGHAIHFTVSIGLAILEPDGSLDGALSNADHALYRAKETGRNRVYGPPGFLPDRISAGNRMA
jgi:diguanylate cyclase (GGDEF)-like protein/PAS domain S-box-containing protein